MVLRPHLYCLPSRFTLVKSLYWVLGLCGVSPGCCCVCTTCTDNYSAGSSASLVQCCRCGGFFPSSAIFRASFGDFCSFLGIFASVPWLRLWCNLFCSVCLFSAYLYPTVTSIVGFSCGPPSLVVPVCVCVWGFFLWWRSCVFFLSSCWMWGRLLLGLFWCSCCAFSWGTCGFPQRALQLVTLLGFRTYLALVSWPTPAVDVYCWVGGVLVHHLVFYLVPAQLPLLLLTLSRFCNLSGSNLLVSSCGGALLLGWRCLWCFAWFSTLCRALPPGPAACAARVSRLRSCLGSYLLLEVLSFPCPGFRWAVPAVWLSRRLVFSWNLSLGSSLSLPVFGDGLGWLGFILGYPPSVAWLWRLLPWFFVRYLLACPRGAAVPLVSLVLWCSWSSR